MNNNLSFQEKVDKIKGKYTNQKESMELDKMVDLFEENEKN